MNQFITAMIVFIFFTASILIVSFAAPASDESKKILFSFLFSSL